MPPKIASNRQLQAHVTQRRAKGEGEQVIRLLRLRFQPLCDFMRSHPNGYGEGAFFAPLPPNIANARLQHWERTEVKQLYCGQLFQLYGAKLIPWPKKPPPSQARLRTRLFLNRPSDADNAKARLKWLVDWLVRFGYLEDDSPRHLELPDPEQVIDSKTMLRIEFMIEPIVEAVPGDQTPARRRKPAISKKPRRLR